MGQNGAGLWGSRWHSPGRASQPTRCRGSRWLGPISRCDESLNPVKITLSAEKWVHPLPVTTTIVFYSWWVLIPRQRLESKKYSFLSLITVSDISTHHE